MSSIINCDVISRTKTERVRHGDDVQTSSFLSSFMDSLCHVRNKIMHVLSWRTVSALTWVLFWCLFPSLLGNSGNKHQNNPLVSTETVHHPSTYIILYIFAVAPSPIGTHTMVEAIGWQCNLLPWILLLYPSAGAERCCTELRIGNSYRGRCIGWWVAVSVKSSGLNWLPSVRLWYLQCISSGDVTVCLFSIYHWVITHLWLMVHSLGANCWGILIWGPLIAGWDRGSCMSNNEQKFRSLEDSVSTSPGYSQNTMDLVCLARAVPVIQKFLVGFASKFVTRKFYHCLNFHLMCRFVAMLLIIQLNNKLQI